MELISFHSSRDKMWPQVFFSKAFCIFCHGKAFFHFAKKIIVVVVVTCLAFINQSALRCCCEGGCLSPMI